MLRNMKTIINLCMSAAVAARLAAGKCLTPVNFNSNESLGTLPFPQRS